MIYLQVDEQVSVRRLSSRGRDDDTPSAIAYRLKQFHKATVPMIDFFNTHKRYNVHEIDGGQHVEKVKDDIFTALDLDGNSRFYE